MMTSNKFCAETSVQFQKSKAEAEVTASCNYINLLVKFSSDPYTSDRNPKIHLCIYKYIVVYI